MGGTHFLDELEIEEPFEAHGLIDTKYEVVSMFVGLIQVDESLTDLDDNLLAAAYGKGVPELDPDAGELKDEQGWSMYLQKDSERAAFDPEKPAIGFVMTELTGGQFTGWIHRGIRLKAKQPALAGSANS